jgi:hypothetical protein
MNLRTNPFSSYIRKPALGTLGLVLMAISLMSVPAHAGKTCSAFSVTIGTKVFSGKQTILVPAAKVNNQIAHVKGTFHRAEFCFGPRSPGRGMGGFGLSWPGTGIGPESVSASDLLQQAFHQ